MTRPSSVDLRSDYEKTYNQGMDNACGPFALANALDCIWERATGNKTRFDPYYIWDWIRFYRGMVGTNTGSDSPSIEKALRINGAKKDGEIIKGFKVKQTWMYDRSAAEMKHLLCMGMPIIWLCRITNGSLYSSRNQGKPWREHTWDTTDPMILGQHYVCIVGYDDVAGRWLVENSWGSDWGDGGFFGMPYDQLWPLNENLSHIDITPISPKPIEGYSVKVNPTVMERAAFADRATQQLTKVLTEAYEAGGPAGLIEACKLWGVSDKHLESLVGWNRRTVRDFKIDNPELNWENFIWDQL